MALLYLLALIPVLFYLLKPIRIPTIPNATLNFPFIGNAISYGKDPVKYLLSQRAQHGDIFLVNLAVFKIVFFLGPECTNAIFRGTDKSGISFWAAMMTIFGGSVSKGNTLACQADEVSPNQDG
jgi:hypothetical protein